MPRPPLRLYLARLNAGVRSCLARLSAGPPLRLAWLSTGSPLRLAWLSAGARLCLVLLSAGACGGERSNVPPALESAPSEAASVAPASPPDASPPDVPPQPGSRPRDAGPPKPLPRDAGPAKAPPRRWAVSRNGKVFLRLTDEPGRIIDTNAPPPPPDAIPPPHPFLSGTCGGEIVACSKAGELLRASSSTKEFLAKLRAAGFDVRELEPGAL
ncbi:MAG TPA: hypothetical protein VFS43_39655 [Polyangiaceae bacterium]|nr:hypothetical protein [Polyangiaceae bacterium]